MKPVARCKSPFSLLAVLLSFACSAAMAETHTAVTIPSGFTGTYNYVVSSSSATGSPLKVGQSLNVVFAPGGGACVAGMLLTSPYAASTIPANANWEGYSLGYRLTALNYASGLNVLALYRLDGTFLASLSGSRTNTGTSTCTTGARDIDFSQLTQLFVKAEQQYPTLFTKSPTEEAYKIVGDAVSRLYSVTGITVTVKNDMLSVTGGPWGSTTQTIGKASDLLTALLNPAAAPRAFPDIPVSATLAGGVMPVLTLHSNDAETRANELAGVTRDATNNWKLYTIGRTRTQVVADLKPKLKGIIDDLWSGGNHLQFPESYGISEGPVEDLVKSMKDFQWEKLPTPLHPNEISNTSYEWLLLKSYLKAGSPDKSALFWPVHADAVDLAYPFGGFDTNASMKLLGPRIKTWVLAYLSANPTSNGTGTIGSGSTGSTGGTGSSTGIDDFNCTATSTAAYCLLSTVDTALVDLYVVTKKVVGTEAVAVKATVNAALNKLPATYSAFKTAASAFMNRYLDQDAPNCITVITGYCTESSLSSQTLVLRDQYNDAYFSAQLQAITETVGGSGSSGSGSGSGSSGSGTTTTKQKAGEYYQVFLGELASALNSIYESEFDTLFAPANKPDSRSYLPLVITAVALDTFRFSTGANDNCCSFRSDELAYYGKSRSAIAYRGMGELVKFSGNSNSRFNLASPVRIQRMDITAPSLNARSGTALTSPVQLILATSSSAAFSIAGCVSTDQYCMARLAKISGPDTQDFTVGASTTGSYAPSDLLFQLGVMRTTAVLNTGIDLVGPAYMSNSYLDQR